MSTMTSKSNEGTTGTDDPNRSFKDELQRKDVQLSKETAKNKDLTDELNRIKSLLEREKRQNEQYARDIETEMEKRDQELEKREQEIFELEERHQRQIVQIDNLKAEIGDQNQQNQSLMKQFNACQRQLKDERNKTLPAAIANETALFDAQSKVEEYMATMEVMKADCARQFNTNCDLNDKIHNLEQELARVNTEKDSLCSLVDCMKNELQNTRDQYTEVQMQLHQLQSNDGNVEIAARGNSLFSEVIDGKDRLEKQLASLHQQNRKLRFELARATKLAYENGMNRAITMDGEVLTGPTLTIFKVLKAELAVHVHEKQKMLEKLHKLEEAERRSVLKMAKENPDEFNIFQEHIHAMTTNEKQRLANRVLRLELREREMLDTIAYEKRRASSVPQLKQKLEQQERMLAHYEKSQLMLDDFDKENGGK